MRRRPLSGAVTGLGVAAIVWLSLTGAPVSMSITPWWDKVEHLAAYGCIGAAAMWTIRPGWRRAGVIAAAGALLGGAMEVAQATLMPGVRFGDVADFLASALGALVGAGLVALWSNKPGPTL